MDSLRRDTWRNATATLASIDAAIAKKTTEINAADAKYQEAREQANHCEAQKEGLFNVYNCSKNTGKTINEWRRIRDYWLEQKIAMKADLKLLNERRGIALKQSLSSSEAATAQSQASQARSISSEAEAKSTLNWLIVVLVGIAIVGGSFMMYKKIKK